MDVISGQHDNVIIFLQSTTAADGDGNHSGENWHEVMCDDECLNSTAGAAPSDVTAIRWTLTDCEDTDDAIRIAELQAVVCAKLSGTLHRIIFYIFTFIYHSASKRTKQNTRLLTLASCFAHRWHVNFVR